MVNILDRAQLNLILSKLEANASPLFGVMSPQHMVEHLMQLMQISNGKLNMPQLFRPEKAEKMKAYLMQPGTELAIGFRAPFLEEGVLLPLQYQDLEEAIRHLYIEIDAYQHFFESNPSATPMHPALGLLNSEEWTIFHNKHFHHHFKQFGLAKSND